MVYRKLYASKRRGSYLYIYRKIDPGHHLALWNGPSSTMTQLEEKWKKPWFISYIRYWASSSTVKDTGHHSMQWKRPPPTMIPTDKAMNKAIIHIVCSILNITKYCETHPPPTVLHQPTHKWRKPSFISKPWNKAFMIQWNRPPPPVVTFASDRIDHAYPSLDSRKEFDRNEILNWSPFRVRAIVWLWWLWSFEHSILSRVDGGGNVICVWIWG